MIDATTLMNNFWNREFRVWDKEQMKMFYMHNMFLTALTGSGPHWNQIKKWKRYSRIDEKLVVMLNSNFEDIEGFPIYEGDIVDVTTDDKTNTVIIKDIWSVDPDVVNVIIGNIYETPELVGAII